MCTVGPRVSLTITGPGPSFCFNSTREHGVKGHRRSNFKSQNFPNWIADLDSLHRSRIAKQASFIDPKFVTLTPNLTDFCLTDQKIDTEKMS